jgi:hypothetical protein
VREAKDRPETMELGGYMITAASARGRGGPGVTFLRREGDRAIYRIEPGTYVFESRW